MPRLSRTCVALTASTLLLLCTAARSAEPEKPAIPVLIEGMLLGPDGAPVDEGFLMLEGNPQLSTITGRDGKFRIAGDAWTMPDKLVASWAGCAAASVPATQAMNAVTIRLVRQDPDFTAIEMGMSLKTRWFLNYERSRPLNAAQKACVAACDRFFAARGDAIVAKMLAGTALADDERDYECIAAARIYTRTTQGTEFTKDDPKPENRWGAQIMAACYRVCRKVVQRERLTADDIHTLRLASAFYGSSGHNPVAGPILNRLGVGYAGAGAGGTIPYDVPLLRTEPLLRSPVWNDITSLTATAHLRLEGLWTFLGALWKWQVRNGQLVEAPVEEWRRHYWQPWYEVTSVLELLRQNRRPLYITCANYEDMTHVHFYERQTEHLRRAYRDTLEIETASQATSTAYVDIFVDEWTHFGPNPAADPAAGLDNPRWEQRDYTPFRHARMDKLCSMDVPFASGDILLDLPRDVSWLAERGGLHHQVILDRDGRVAVPFPGRDYTMMPAIGTGFYADYGQFASWNRQGGDSYFCALVNEQILRALLGNDGRFIEGSPFVPSTWDRVTLQAPPLFHAKDDAFIVRSIDQERGIIHAGWFDPGIAARYKGVVGNSNPVYEGGLAEAKGDFQFKLQPGTRYSVRCKDKKPAWIAWNTESDPPGATYRPGTLDDFAPGQKFFATIRLPAPPAADATLGALLAGAPRQGAGTFDMRRYDGKELVAERLMNYSHVNAYGGMHPRFMPVYGSITAKQDEVITVAIRRDDVRAMRGYRFWKEEEVKGRKPERMPRLFWPTLKRWADGSDEDRVYRFRVDGATDVFRNGLVARATDLAVGDAVFIEYEMWWETQGMHRDVIAPERIQASDPIVPRYVPPLVRALRAQGMAGTDDEILVRLRAPSADLLAPVAKAMSVDEARVRTDAVTAMRLLVTAKAITEDAATAALEAEITRNQIAEGLAFQLRRQLHAKVAPCQRSWQVVGPFPQGLTAKNGPERDGFDPAETFPSAKVPAGPDGAAGRVGWKAFTSSRDFVDLGAGIKPTPQALGYAACWVQATAPCRIAVDVGNDNTFFLWLNGTRLRWEPYRYRPAAPAQARVFVDLKAGWNRILMQVENNGGPWGFYLQLYGMDGLPLDAPVVGQPPPP